MVRKALPSPDPEDVRKDLLAALAAGRELGPEMDAAIVDAHLRRHFGDALNQPKPPAVVERRPIDLTPLVMPLTLLIGLAAFIAILSFSHGELWFLAFPLLGWWRWGGHWARHRGSSDHSLNPGSGPSARLTDGSHEII
jgi:hypothetical protein